MVCGSFWDVLQMCGVLSVRAGGERSLEMRARGSTEGILLAHGLSY